MCRRNRQMSLSFMAFRVSKKKSSTPIQTIKLVMFGSGGVGKTSLVHRFLFNKFDSAYTATVEDDYREVITYNKHIVDVTVLDTSGSFQFPAMRRHAIQHGHGFIIVYAVDNPNSLEEAKRLYNEVITCKNDVDCPIVLVGNKIDKSPLGNRKVSREQVNKILLNDSMNVEHIETSAKINHNVSLVFNKLIGFIDERNMANLSTSISPNKSSNLSKSTMRLNSMSKYSLNSKSTYNLQRSLSLDNHLDTVQETRKTKKKLLKKFFSSRGKTVR
ncbi:GTP-binding protein Di-Ras2-like isoform X2 [Clytia hemisphaerica]|uniref:GTP-binding protein Di-Ras2-like isoform X2 n=1 Tax=Clytia hemisphaerica TaxID=252671 RepID=UPI0034D78016